MSNQDQPRVAKGTPKRGGQWSSEHTAEAGNVEHVELADPESRYCAIRPDQRAEIVRQIGSNIWSISGGRVTPIEHGVELPASSGYRVRVKLQADDLYTVERVYRHGGRGWIKGTRANVFYTDMSQAAYRCDGVGRSEPRCERVR